MSKTADEYRQQAATCIVLAERITNPRIKASMLAMAEAWLRLCVQAEKNESLDISYETPSSQPQIVRQQEQQQLQRKLTEEDGGG